MKNQEIIISVVMPTFNSAKTLDISLQSMRDQDFPQDQIEILIIDGGSTDATIDIAKKYGAKILDNPKRLPEYAKIIGCKKAQGKYIVFHDSDEVILNRSSFSNKYNTFEKYGDIGSIVSTSCTNPKVYAIWGEYTNLIGDPFTAFVYGWSPESYLTRFSKGYHIESEDPISSIFKWNSGQLLPIIDAAGHMFLRSGIQEVLERDEIGKIAEINIQRTGRFAVTKDDYIEHHSSVSFGQILRKIRFRIINNVYGDKGAGYNKREDGLPKIIKYKKYLFMIYGLSIIFPFFRGLIWIMKTRKLIFIAEPLFAFYTVIMIIFYMLAKLTGKSYTNSQYG